MISAEAIKQMIRESTLWRLERGLCLMCGQHLAPWEKIPNNGNLCDKCNRERERDERA